jgi:hypothetical protein
MNSLILIAPKPGSGCQPIISGKEKAHYLDRPLHADIPAISA